jgi:hypothetical protein
METTMERKSQFSTWTPLGSWLKGVLGTLYSLGIWKEKQAMAAAVAMDHSSGYQVTTAVAEVVSTDEFAAPVSRGVKRIAPLTTRA